MYNFKNTIENVEVHTAGLHKELSKTFPFTTQLESDQIIKTVDIESQCSMEMREWGIKSINLYTTKVSLYVSFLEHDAKKFEIKFDDEWKFDDEFNDKKISGKKPTSIYFDFNQKTITIYYS